METGWTPAISSTEITSPVHMSVGDFHFYVSSFFLLNVLKNEPKNVIST